jgi:hypothetical protein
MNKPIIDDDLVRAHELFRKNHEAGRERLLGMLCDEVPTFLSTRRYSMRSVLRVLASRPLTGHLRTKLTVAAVFLAVLTLGVYALWQSPQRAYALEDLPQRLLEIKSIYMTGWMYSSFDEPREIGPPKYPVKIFAERPDCYYHTSYSFSGPDTTRKQVEVRSGYVAGKGQKQICVSTEDKKAYEGFVSTTDNEMSTEMLIQMELGHQLLSGNLRDYSKKGTETVNAIECNVYERSFEKARIRSRVWHDPKTGLPVKIASYGLDEAGRETPRQIIDHVEVNIPVSATGLSFDPPEGYEVVRSPQSQDIMVLQPISSGTDDEIDLGVWHCFNIDDKAALLCWYCDPQPGAKDGDLKVSVEFRFTEDQPCNQVEIATTESGCHRWYWSLLFPKKAGERIGNDDLTVAHRTKNGGELSVGNFPIQLQDARLNAILREVQRQAKIDIPGSSEPFTLETLRATIAKHK